MSFDPLADKNLHREIRSKYSTPKSATLEKTDDLQWQRTPSVLSLLSNKAALACKHFHGQPSFFEYLRDTLSAEKESSEYRMKIRHCVNEIENAHAIKFEKELHALYQCKQNCENQKRESMLNTGRKFECYKLCVTSFNLNVEERVKKLEELFEKGDIENYLKHE